MYSLSRNAQVLKYFAERVGPVGRTKHIKLVYLTDLAAREYLGEPISEFEYVWWDEGPFDTAFYHAREDLESAGLGKERPTHYPNGKTEQTFRDTGESVDFDFGEAERGILDAVVEKYGDYELNALLSVVYETEPMKQASGEEEPLPMDVVDNREARETGLDLERLYEARRAAAEGNVVGREEFFRGLQDEITSAGTR